MRPATSEPPERRLLGVGRWSTLWICAHMTSTILSSRAESVSKGCLGAGLGVGGMLILDHLSRPWPSGKVLRELFFSLGPATVLIDDSFTP